MKSMFVRHTCLIAAVGLLFAQGLQGQEQRAGFTTSVASDAAAVPESVGLSTARLKLLNDEVQQIVDKHQLAGAVTLLARHGKIVAVNTYGCQDVTQKTPMRKDSIFRLYSETKPVTAVAMLILYEEGKWQLDDPISKHIPEFAGLKVLKGVDKDGKLVLETPAHPPTMRELMTHTAGFAYGLSSDTPVDKMYAEQRVLQSASLSEMIGKLSKMPLLYQPGTRWVYSLSVDIQGYLVEKLSGKPLSEFMHERIFEPLGMKDTDFYVPPEKLDRFVSNYEWDGTREEIAPAKSLLLGLDFVKRPRMPLAGAGLVSTAEDYFRFCQMILNGGELDGVRILSPRSVELLRANHLPQSLMTSDNGVGLYHFGPGVGFAFNMPVVVDSLKAGTLTGNGSLTWGGAGQTWFWIDPTYDIVFVGMVQLLGIGPNNMDTMSRTLVYQALVKPEN
jgi:CubicO group peptidase (beta-lactamase class C family)